MHAHSQWSHSIQDQWTFSYGYSYSRTNWTSCLLSVQPSTLYRWLKHFIALHDSLFITKTHLQWKKSHIARAPEHPDSTLWWSMIQLRGQNLFKNSRMFWHMDHLSVLQSQPCKDDSDPLKLVQHCNWVLWQENCHQRGLGWWRTGHPGPLTGCQEEISPWLPTRPILHKQIKIT